MENPATWGELEKVISAALRSVEFGRSNGMIGLSAARQIADALRAAGLVKDG